MERQEQSIKKGDLLLFNRNGTIRTGIVQTKGRSRISINVAQMKTNTQIPVDSELVPVTIYVTKEVLNMLEVA
ncbi:hypothetical protein H6G33_10440 [Calothrix sp. FACHB-1219]|uniref:hypothetical protein n=1 Tax=unclassified Calothrix TaxID=2619626 RepID=UPI00168287F9|nr:MULTISPECIES: hypothetical protein [unclassified Calothrix]MBD2201765.1 hypothetical protein [Calothrix sp. FACHB-168]MBD2217451.1 hypothetical protein [Calothrix sp. FACHB-1219]